MEAKRRQPSECHFEQFPRAAGLARAALAIGLCDIGRQRAASGHTNTDGITNDSAGTGLLTEASASLTHRERVWWAIACRLRDDGLSFGAAADEGGQPFASWPWRMDAIFDLHHSNMADNGRRAARTEHDKAPHDSQMLTPGSRRR